MIHALKIKTEYFEAVTSGKKLFEVRVNDRNYKVDDWLALNEIDENKEYTGRSCIVYVDYILDIQVNDLVVMTIKPVAAIRAEAPRDPFKTIHDYSVPIACGSFKEVL